MAAGNGMKSTGLAPAGGLNWKVLAAAAAARFQLLMRMLNCGAEVMSRVEADAGVVAVDQ